MGLRKALLFTFLLLGILLPPGLHAEDIGDIVYAKGFSIKVLDFDESSLRVELTNSSKEPPTSAQRRVTANFWIAVPPGSLARYSQESAEYIAYPEEGEPSDPFSSDEECPLGTIPTGLARPTGSVIDSFRTIGLTQFSVPVTAWVSNGGENGESGTVVLNKGVFSIKFEGGKLDEPPSPTNLEERDPYLLDFGGRIVANPEQIPLVTRAPDPIKDLDKIKEWADLLKKASENGPVVMFKIGRSGVYKITPSELSRLGLDPANFNPNRMRMLVGNREIPINFEQLVDGPFVGDTSITFFVPEPSEYRTPYQPLWLFQVSEDDPQFREPKAMERQPDRGIKADVIEGEGRTTLHLFQPNVFELRHPFTDETGRWALGTCTPGTYFKHEFDVEGLKPESEAVIELSYGGYYSQRSRQSQLYINGERVGPQEEFFGQGPNVKQYTLPPGLLQEGRNTLAVFFPDSGDSTQDEVLAVSYANVTYSVDLKNFPINQKVEVSSPKAGKFQIEIPRPSESYKTQTFFLDVTDPYTPFALPLRSSAPLSAGHRFMGWMEATEEPRTLIYSDQNSVMYPGAARVFKYDELLFPSEATDYLVIASEDTITGVDDLMKMREDDDFAVRKVDVDSIYAIFSYGYMKYEPIHTFLRQAFNDWPGARLQRVLLVGEASEFWWQYSFPTAGISPNQIPIFGWGQRGVTIRGDDSYALICGNGPLADIEIGRIPSSDYEETVKAGKRIQEYEDAPPAGPWSTRHLFITDDEPEFARVSERVIRSELTDVNRPERIYLQDFPYEDYFRIISRKRSTAMTEAIIDALSRGGLTATYFGHGGPNLWSAERIFHYRDIEDLHTEGRRPVMAAASCDTAWVDYPVEPVRRSLAERFLLSENGGAIGIFAPVAGTSSFEHDYIIRPFYKAFEDPAFKTLGEITLYAKLEYMLDRNQSYVPNQFILLGDPGLKIYRPSRQIGLEISPAGVFANEQAEIVVKGRAPRIAWGLAEVTLLDEEGRPVDGVARARVVQSQFEAKLQLPPFVKPGSYRLIVQAYNKSEGYFETIEQDFPVREPDVRLEWSSDAPTDKAIPSGAVVNLKLEAENRSEGFMQNLVLELRDATADASLTSHPLSLAPGQELEWEFPVPAPPGVRIFSAKVDYERTEPGQAPLAESAIVVRAVPDKDISVAVPDKIVEIQRIAAPPQTSFEIPVYNLKDKPLVEVTADFLLLDTEKGTAVGKTIRAGRIPPLGKGILKFSSNSRFPEGTLPFRLTINGREGENGKAITQTVDMGLRMPVGCDIEVVPGSVRPERDAYVRGETVFIRADVRNRGGDPAENLLTTLYVGAPWWEQNKAPSATNEAEVTFEKPLLPGETREVRLRWDPPSGFGRQAALFVVTNSSRKIVESDYRNNVGDTIVSMASLPNLAIDGKDIIASQDYVADGEVISLTIPYWNTSAFDFSHPFVIEVDAEGPETEPMLVYRGVLDRLDAGERGMIQIPWHVTGMRDRVTVSVNSEREYGESVLADNTALLDFEYVLNQKYLGGDPDFWTFNNTMPFGSMDSLFVSPDNSLELIAFPEAGERITFKNEYVVGEPLPKPSLLADSDNMMALDDQGAISWTPYETPAPVQLRIPMPKDDGTTLYDVYVEQMGANSPDDKPSNFYRYRSEDQDVWKDIKDRFSAMVYLDRVETKDDFLDISFTSHSIVSWNKLRALQIRPVKGRYTSPLFEVDGLRAFTFEPDYRAGGEAKVLFDFRVGTGNRYDPQFGDWQPLQSGERVAANPDATALQWRCTIFGDRKTLPKLRNVIFRFAGESEIAEANP
ncbi:hypothetical protein KQI84_15285 [bacterium]|nr:hypothetical protein [bacterium]